MPPPSDLHGFINPTGLLYFDLDETCTKPDLEAVGFRRAVDARTDLEQKAVYRNLNLARIQLVAARKRKADASRAAKETEAEAVKKRRLAKETEAMARRTEAERRRRGKQIQADVARQIKATEAEAKRIDAEATKPLKRTEAAMKRAQDEAKQTAKRTKAERQALQDRSRPYTEFLDIERCKVLQNCRFTPAELMGMLKKAVEHGGRYTYKHGEAGLFVEAESMGFLMYLLDPHHTLLVTVDAPGEPWNAAKRMEEVEALFYDAHNLVGTPEQRINLMFGRTITRVVHGDDMLRYEAFVYNPPGHDGLPSDLLDALGRINVTFTFEYDPNLAKLLNPPRSFKNALWPARARARGSPTTRRCLRTRFVRETTRCTGRAS